jgi:TRAP-type C4-dicarboxylate transport system substrate-binding protein
MIVRSLPLLAAAAWTCARPALAEEPTVTFRIATIAPDGTAWAREARAFSRSWESGTSGAVHVKWYFGAIAGSELMSLERLRRGQLDGLAGSLYCEQLAPSLRALEVVGMVRSPQQAANLLKTLGPQVERELAGTPLRPLFVSLGFGHNVLFSRKPVRSLAELRQGKYWVWEVDEVLRTQLTAMGINTVPLSLDEGVRAYEEHRVDGFFVVAQGALAFQYSTVAKYYTDLETAYLPGCVVVRVASLDQLRYPHQQQLLDAAGKLKARFEEVGTHMDAQLLGTLFIKQGLEAVPMSPGFREEWFRAGRAAYEQLREQLVPSVTARQVLEASSAAAGAPAGR